MYREGGGAVIFFFVHIFWGCLHGLSGTFALFFFRCLVENVLIKLINRKMSCSTVVVVVAINVIAAGREEQKEELLLQVKICMCRLSCVSLTISTSTANVMTCLV